MVYPGEGPNLLPMNDPMTPNLSSSIGSLPPRANPRTGLPPRRKSTKTAIPKLELKTGRPSFEKNRCTVILTHGDPDKALEESKRKKRTYLVASDLSDESLFAIQWAIGTVLREGDDCIIVSVMETDSKCTYSLSSSLFLLFSFPSFPSGFFRSVPLLPRLLLDITDTLWTVCSRLG